MTIREKNIEAIKKKNKKLYTKLINIQDEYTPKEQVETKLAKDGKLIVSTIRDGKEVMLNSTYRPEIEAQKFIKKYDDLVPNSILLFLGLGNGMFAREIIHMKQQDNILFFYEPSLDIFMKVIDEFDLTDIFDEQRVEIFVKELNEDEIGLYLSANLNHMNLYLTFMESLPKYKDLFPEDFIELYHIYDDKKRFVRMDINTRLKVRKEFMINPIRNLEYTFHAKSAYEFRKIFSKNMPAILVSAGPSLEKNVEILKQAKGKAFIFAVDTAAIYLLNHGIEPDMVAAIDYLKPLRLFQDERLKKIPLVILTDFNYKVMELLDGTDFIYGSTDLQMYKDYFNHFNKKIDGVPQGGSVATYAFALLQYWGFEQIIFVGQDLALTGEKHHAGEGSIKPEERRKDLIEVVGNVEDKVYTSSDYYAYLRWFEMAVAHYYKKEQIINATEGGAKIEGMKIMPLKEAVDLYCKEEYPYQELFEQVPYVINPEQYQEAYDYLKEQLKVLKTFKKKMKEGKDASERAAVLVERNDILGKEFKKLNQKLDKVCKYYDKTPMGQIVSKLSADTEIPSVIDLYIEQKDEKAEMLRLYNKLNSNYTGFYNHIDEVTEVYSETMDRIQNKYHLI